ncbi:uncharacterized protein LOC8058750 isoform X1 [Sorghum bicolor]|uniref:Uncharacterized protein n=1 Tax=Sorghum bicolor TaxID=4558 RepID=A0A1Z5S8L1_SORBI|nr:uncharacterized protein LOC8058750 isoform X1 [Sorghum bicolor]OQU92165.1 hypothetical protein SORBI_3001G303675 [Sorghum bicolor]OQU92166.1 hypothetical protein SORBI_3001G303675 [Sorghum bicolor]|eukprot:XP_021307099.1 uncharacterized protein LOC8058750 isoform X1 [Sorghum bicolor]
MNARFVLPWLMDFAQYEMLLTENVAHHAPKLETRTRGGVRHGGAGRGTSPLAAPALTNRGGTCNHPQSLAITLHRTRDSPFSPIVTQVGSKLAPPAGVHNHIRLHGLHPTASVRLALSRRLQGIGLPQTSPGFNAATVRHPQPAVSPRSPSLVIESEAPRAPSLLWHCLLKTSGRQRQLHGNPSHRRTPVIVMHRPKGSSGKSTFSLQLVRGRPALLPPGAPVAAGPQGASWATKPAPPATKAASHGHCRSSTPLQARPRGGVRPSVTMRRRTGHSRAIPTSPRPSAGGRCICAQMDSDARSPSIWRLCRTADGLLLFVSLRVDCQYVFALTSALPTYKNAQSLLIHINAFLTEVIFLLI